VSSRRLDDSEDPEVDVDGAVSVTAAAAVVASFDAEVASISADGTTIAANAAAESATDVASRARVATAALVAEAASSAAQTAERAAAAVEAEAIARAIDVAALAVEALETIAAALPADVDREGAQRAAALVAKAVAADVVARSKSTAEAATTVAAAVAMASEAAAVAAADAASAVERAAAAAEGAGAHLKGSSTATAEASTTVVESTARVADLAARLRVVAALRESEARFRYTFERAPVGMLLVSLGDDDGGRILRVNKALCDLTGRAEAELLAQHERELFHLDDRNVQSELFASLLASGDNSAEASARWTRADGRELWVRVSMLAVHEGGDSPGYAVCQVQDMTGRRRAETALQVREARFRQAFDRGLTGVMFLRLDGLLRQSNEAVYRFLHTSEKSLVGRSVDSLVREDDRADIRTAVEELVSGKLDSYQAEHRFERPDGSYVWGLVRGSLVQDEDGRPDYLVFQMEDVTARKEAEVRLAHQALHDHLTGLPNRVLLRDHLQLAGFRARRNGTHLAVLFVDVDDFKEVNDTLGHVVGDKVLMEIAARLTGCLRETDTAARLGGDEFVLLCEDLRDPPGVGAVVTRVLDALAPPITVAGRQIRVTASVGVTTDAGVATPEELIGEADTAMYRAKTNGKNRHQVFESGMRVGVVRQAELLAELERAIHCDELRLHYQPMYCMRTGAVLAVEALLRWQHPVLGLLPPGDFLDVVEGRPLMTPLGDWVLTTAAAQAAAWQRSMGTAAPDMWVNISSEQLGRQHFIGVVEDVLASTGASATKLGLELTERQLVGRADAVASDLLAVQKLGLRLAVDDFGTGYASMDYLRRFTFDEIKIDKSFIDGLGSDRTDTAITSSIIELGRSLDLVVVAEGVETQVQYDRLQELGCGVSQGYLHHRPAPPQVITRLLARAAVRSPRALT
jgi:diguanylate cyclase (GGDEF)-like protein/PAS domain S-box-containing protein